MAVGCHFASTQTVGLAEFHPVGTAAGIIAVAARNAICGREPKMAEIIIQDCMNGCAAEACSRHRRKVLPVPQIPSVTLCADQQSSIAALQEGGDHVARKAICRGEVGDRRFRSAF